MDNDKGKIILKRSALPGVDMSVVDLELVSTVKIRVTILKKVMYKIRRQTFIGTRDQLDDMDVIQLGSLRLKYRVIKLIKLDDYGGYIYRIKRIDGEPTIGIDIDNASKLGQKINIVNRPTFDDLFNYACSLREEVLKEEEDCYTGEVCDTKSPIIPIIPIDPVVPPCVSKCYEVTTEFNVSSTLNWVTCDGVEESLIVPFGGVDYICASMPPTGGIAVELGPCAGPLEGCNIVRRYQVCVPPGGTGIVVNYTTYKGQWPSNTTTTILPNPTSPVCIEFCAVYGSIYFDGDFTNPVYAVNESCPSVNPCNQPSELTYLPLSPINCQ